ncbi:MAG: hypothetical protein MJZ34_13315 [Paludibacteraceae bacterium]|nr:hypothetical protein [Paludibacteraceae bacterium]
MKKRNLALSGSAVNESTPSVTLYELTNHLSNVLAVITDEDNGSSNEPKVESLTDYYPFGMEMGGRSYNSNDYRFGYTGHEKENDLAEGVYTTQYRLLDTRLGRWMSVDPLFAKYPDMSAYNYCGGNPVAFVDNNGDTLVIKYWWGGHEETYLYSGPTTKVEVDNEFVKTVVETLNYLYGYEESRSNIQTLMLSRSNVAISEVSEISEDAPGKAKPTLQRFAN